VAADRRRETKRLQTQERNRLIYDKWLDQHPTKAALAREFGIGATAVAQIIARADRRARTAARRAAEVQRGGDGDCGISEVKRTIDDNIPPSAAYAFMSPPAFG